MTQAEAAAQHCRECHPGIEPDPITLDDGRPACGVCYRKWLKERDARAVS